MDKQEQKRLTILLVVLSVVAAVAIFRMWEHDHLPGSTEADEEFSYIPRDLPDLIATGANATGDETDDRDHRNPFTYGSPPTPTPNLTPQPTPTPRPTATPNLTPRPTPPPRGTPKPRPPAFDREFIGHFGPDRLRVAAFRKPGADGVAVIDVATVGETIDETFIVREIGLESVVIGYVGFDQSEDTRVPLAEK